MDLLDKYTIYKRRFYKSFIAYDDYKKDGTNLPASLRQLWGKNSKFICWGDTTIDMTYYIMYLASEYYNYKKSNRIKDSEETLKKLYYALKSIERLDYKAEYNYRSLNFWICDKGPKPEDLNGFFIRDDVPKDFLKDYFHLTLKDEFDIVDKVESFWSDWSLWTGEKNYRAGDMSQDQVWHLLVGFAFVKKIFVDEGSLTYEIGNEKVNISELTVQIPKRILDYMFITCKLQIKNPVFNLPVPRGADMNLFAYGFAKAGQELTGYDYTKHLKWYHKPLYRIAIPLAENVLYNGLSKFMNKFFKKQKSLQIAIKNYSYRALGVTGNVKFGGNISKKVNEDAIAGDYLHFPYIYSLLHGGKIDPKVNEVSLNRLRSAPDTGPFNFSKDSRSEDIHWTSPNSLINSLKCKELGDDVAHLGVYNGLDYLLLYNLYKMKNKI